MKKELKVITNSQFSEEFLTYHSKNPKVYDLFKQYTLQLLENGHTRVGARLVIERIRWDNLLNTIDSSKFKIRNVFVADYSRLFMKDFPQYGQVFNTATRSVKLAA